MTSREPCDRAGAQVVAVREPARDDDNVGPANSASACLKNISNVAELLDRPPATSSS